MPDLTERVSAYAEAVKAWPPADHQFIPHPATWFNEGRYDDDPNEWKRNATHQPKPNPRAYSQTADYSGV